MNKNDFYRRYPDLARLDKRYRHAFRALARCMPPRPSQISKTELNRRAKRVSASWALLSKQTHSERIAILIEHGLFLPDYAEPRFICMTEKADEYRELLETSETDGNPPPSAARGDSSPDVTDV